MTLQQCFLPSDNLIFPFETPGNKNIPIRIFDRHATLLNLNMKQYRFIREGPGWYIDLPEYLEQGGSKADLEMVSGADTMLDIIAGEKNEVTLKLDTAPFKDANELILTELCDPILGGGYYHIKRFEEKEVNRDLWLCDVTRFVFGNIPEKIYLKRVE